MCTILIVLPEPGQVTVESIVSERSGC